MNKRKLTNEEKQDILESMISTHPDPNFLNPSGKEMKTDPDHNFVIENARRQVAKQLEYIEVYPAVIPQLKEEILRQYAVSFISPGEMVGCIAATSIGEVQTQSSLNSVVYDTRVLLFTPEGAREDCIGHLIDAYMQEHLSEVKRSEYGGYIETSEANKTYFIETIDVSDKQWKISSVNEEGEISLQAVTGLVRHPLYSGLIKVTTESGRCVVATVGESFLVESGGKILPKYGKDLTINDRIPVTLQEAAITEVSSIHISEWVRSFGTYTAYIPENIELNSSFGFFLGMYLSCDGETETPIYDIMRTMETIRRVNAFYEDWQEIWQTQEIYLIEDILDQWLDHLCLMKDEIKRVPDCMYTAPLECVRALFEGVFQGCGKAKDNEIVFTTSSELLVDGLMTLLGRIGVYSKKEKYRTKWILCVPSLGDNLIRYHSFESTAKAEVILERIASIERVKESPKWVYDFSVEDTKNFSILGGMHMRDSFHSSGQKKTGLSTGLARFQELINLTRQMKVPVIQIQFNPKFGNLLNKTLPNPDPESKEKILNPNSLRFVREIVSTQIEHVRLNDLIVSYQIEERPRREFWYICFERLYSDAHKECTHRLRLQLDRNKLFKCKKDMSWIAVQIKKIERSSKTRGLMHIAFSDNYTAQLDIWLDNDSLSSCEDILASKEMDREDIDKLMNRITESNKGEICLQNVVLPMIRMTDISGVPGIFSCYISDPHSGGPVYTADTRGGSLRDVLQLECVDPRKCESNNVFEIYELFGIEACYQYLINQFMIISEGKVNRRHLDIMIDWMCSTGKLSSVNRFGQDINKIGPMAKASFEQPLDAFLKAASMAQTEVIGGVSASIATGNLPRIGTGSFHMLLDVEKLMTIKPEEEMIAEEEKDELPSDMVDESYVDIFGQEDDTTMEHYDNDDDMF